MQFYQKFLIGLFSTLIVLVTAGTIYAAHLYGSTETTIDRINKKFQLSNSSKSVDTSIKNKKPFSILLMGIDTGEDGRTDRGRSDSMMLVAVNPEKEESTIVSLDRDILTDIVGYQNNGQPYFDKLNHAYAYGSVDMSLNTVEKLVNVPVNHYVSMDMKGLSDLIDAVGGIDVDNKIAFELNGIRVPEGKQKLNGKTGLAYARMRYEDPEGDIGRQRRQREVVEKILKKVISMDSIVRYQKILKAVEKNVLTDLSWDDMLSIGKNYTSAFDKVKTEQLHGKDDMINEVYYQILGVNELLKVQNILKDQLNLKRSETLSIDQKYRRSTNGLIGNQFYNDTKDTSNSQSVFEFGAPDQNLSKHESKMKDSSDETKDEEQ